MAKQYKKSINTQLKEQIVKRAIMCLCMLTLFLGITSPAMAAKWYEGGTLHEATRTQWAKATYENRLATCGEYVASSSTGARLLKTKGWNALKPRSIRMEKHMTDILTGEKYKKIDVPEAAIMCLSALDLEDMK